MKSGAILVSIFMLLISVSTIIQADQPALHGTIVTKGKTGCHDVMIKTRIQTAYGLNPLINHFSLDVNTQAGIVTVKGALQNNEQKELALKIASSVEGVKQVVDNIKVDPRTAIGEVPYSFGQKVKDATLTSMVKSKLLLNPNTKGSDIKVTTVNNTVTLKGNVVSLEEKEIAEKVAIKTAGVSTVRNYLTVNNE